jgi:hypothetical protein
VIAHEFGHVLGLPDLYDVNYKSCGDGPWTLMAGGSWGGPLVSVNGRLYQDGSTPADLDPWSKQLLGWLTPTTITSTTSGLSLDGDSTPNVYKIYPAGTVDRPEYFLLENRQRGGSGHPDNAIPGTGTLIWHIDEAIANPDSKYFRNNTVNAKGRVKHYGVAVMEADVSRTNPSDLFANDCSIASAAGDPFTASSDVANFAHETLPSSALWSRQRSGITISSFSGSGNAMSADVTIGEGNAAPAWSPPTVSCRAINNGCVRGQVKDSTGAGRPYASVTLFSTRTGKSVQATADYQGNFAIVAKPNTGYLLFASAVGLTQTAPLTNLTVTAGQTLTGQDLTLQRPTAVIRGRVTSATSGAGLAGATILIRNVDASPSLQIPVTYTVTTNSAGYYQIPIKAGVVYKLYFNGALKTTLTPTADADTDYSTAL